MAKTNIQINGYYHEVSVDPLKISSIGDKSHPFLNIPLEFTFKFNPKKPFILLNVKATLALPGFNFRTSEASTVCNYSVLHQNSAYHPTLQFPLDAERIVTIEKYRKEDVPITMNLEVQYGEYDFIIVTKGGQQEEKRFISDVQTSHENLRFEIPHSKWIKEILPKLGFKAFELIEIPVSNDLIPEKYKLVKDELVKASEYFNAGDYDKAVAHCRAALDPLNESLKEVKPWIKSKKEKDWISDVTSHSVIWLDTMVKQTYRLTSKTHHLPSIDHFDRHEAEIIYHITIGIVAYFGKIELPKSP